MLAPGSAAVEPARTPSDIESDSASTVISEPQGIDGAPVTATPCVGNRTDDNGGRGICIEGMGAPLRRSLPDRPLVVLAVDDEETRAAYAFGLTATGFDVTTDGDPTTWRSRAFGGRPSIIVAGVSEDGRDGWMPVQRFRRDPVMRDVPIVAVAAEVGAATRDRARREGCAAVCLNSCPPDVLASGLRAVLDHTTPLTPR